jgi:CDP-diglyceride synthetase
VLPGLVFAIASIALIIWALVDVIRRPKEAFVAAGRTRGIWIGLLLVALIAPPIIGAGIGFWYLIAVRPKVAAVMPSRIPPADER